MTMFHHGSLDGTIIGMTQNFKNSMPIFQGVGQFGSLRSPEAGAPRYVGVKFNENFRLLYQDFDLVVEQEEEGEKIEPKFFLPIFLLCFSMEAAALRWVLPPIFSIATRLI